MSQKNSKILEVLVEDIDNPEWTEQDFTRAKPGYELPSHLLAAFPKTRGRPLGSNKALISLRLDSDVIAYFRATGAGWQSRINAVLKDSAKL
jgi:uncharacterized protein (DUF4415 family)